MPRLSKIGAAALAAFGWTSGSSVSASYLVVAGGGAGSVNAAGGGAGGYTTGTTSLNPTQSYTVIVGAGGSPGTLPGNGSNSQFASLTASVGGGGGNTNSGTGNGGSGGGGIDNATYQTGGTGTSGQGNNGGNSLVANHSNGGGGGAGAVGSSGTSSNIGGVGGVGLSNSISGSAIYYAGGGGGAGPSGGSAGGNGGGGSGNSGSAGNPGTSNTGGGGGGGYAAAGSNGGSGVVIISYPAPQKFGGGVVTTSGGNTIHTFTTSGTLSPLTSLSASYLIVAGGAGGGVYQAGGGGAGGVVSGSGLTIDSNSTYLVTVGAGGTATSLSATQPGNGGTSSFSMVTTSSVGGGSGASNYSGFNARSGGSGGGGNSSGGGAGTSGQGNNGGTGATDSSTYANGGGGGGAGSVGGNSTSSVCGSGGVGVTSSISGVSTYYAGGGGGSGTGTAGSGGTGGGGTGGSSSGTSGTSGASSTGGGGGGGGTGSGTGTSGAGGSGIVIISYAGSTQQMAGGTVTISGGNVIHTFTSSGYLTPIKYVNNSLRFRSSASAYLNRTFGTPTNNKIFTWSGWIKIGTIPSSREGIFVSTNGALTSYWGLEFNASAGLTLYDINVGGASLVTTQVFRDPSSWYHVVVAIDTTQATASNRAKLYINGTQITSFSTATYPAQNSSPYMNTSGNIGYIGNWSSAGGYYLDGYLTEINFIDGQALTPNSFGTFNSYGVWQPITYGGSYGTNGFYLPFTNKTSTTTLGYDFSPNGNNWTTNNISLTAGSTYDSMTDVPTLTSATAANYCVLNPLQKVYGNPSTSNGNLTGTSSSADAVLLGTMGITSGKWYAECTATSVSGGLTVELRDITGSSAISYTASTGAITGTTAGATFTSGDVIGVAYDFSAQTVAFYKNNVLQGTSTGVSQTLIWSFGNYIPSTSNTVNWNFGQRPFSFSPPSGYVALNTYNL